jgi:hypothetical protein
VFDGGAFDGGKSKNQTAPILSPATIAVVVTMTAVQGALVWCVRKHAPDARSQILSVLSLDAETTRPPSGVTAHAVTLSA